MDGWMLTLIVTIGATIALAVYDVAVIKRSGVPASISMVVLGSWKRWPPILFALGYLMGHLTWPQHVDSAPVDCVRCAVECKR